MRRLDVVLRPLAWSVAAILAFASTGCGGTTCATSDECSDAEYCPLEDGACLAPVRAERSCTERPTECPKVLSLVCGCDGKTYDNGCLAAVQGVSVAAVGACIVTCDQCGNDEYCGSELGACGQGTTCLPRPASCPPGDAPVCGCDGTTYSSVCEAQAAGSTIFSEGPCEIACGGAARTECPEGYSCELAVGGCLEADPIGLCRLTPTEEECNVVDNPVCGCDGQTYRSSCAAALNGVAVETEGACPCGPGLASCLGGDYCAFPLGTCADAQPVGDCQTVPLECPDVSSPVCGCNGETFDSDCAAAFVSVNVFSDGPCPCGPGLAGCSEGSFCEYRAGTCGEPDPVGTCAVVPGDCPNTVVPVCGCDGEDYVNACEAAQEGFSIRVVGPCVLPG